VAAFETRVAAEGAPLPAPAGVAGEDGSGFSTGGDRRSLRLKPEDEALIAAVSAHNPRTVVVVIAGSYLGSLSHTLTSLDAIRRRHLMIQALVVNETAGSTVPMADTVTTLKRFARSTPVVTLRHSPIATDQAFAEIAALF